MEMMVVALDIHRAPAGRRDTIIETALRSACCAPAASGYAAAPPSVAKNFRRAM